ncbi:FGGY-family carbohydrate kinase [Phyllobacterium sp. YR531]|uniref:FGGY-family carbohydrate kinase n=1 Tax=Phyllobacterium sp. YR531 TaxID=1144343 RepID=UPI00026F6416|nr:FGGY-family carbohydrate kinase [Phyllobacterium sp. YR531]EJN02747.1 ribulose kinase [Phyllobacterium sp. YR531]
MTLVLNFDLGTGGVRAGVYDVERRTMLSTSEFSYSTTYPRAGWAEQQAEEWWSAVLIAGRDAVARCGSSDIVSVCVATTASSVVVCDKESNPLYPAILWMDCRASDEARATESIDHPVMDYSGGGDAAEWLVPKAMWLSAHEPAIFERADIICEALDFINFRLCGEWAGSRMNAACKWNYDSRNGNFVPEIYEALGVPELQQKLPQRIVPVGGVIGELQSKVADALGISGPAIVAQGGIDAHIGVLGAGTVAAGGMLIIGGTSVVHLTHLQEQGDVSGFWGPYPNALVEGLWLVEAGQVSAGSILNWFSQKLFGLDEQGHSELIREASKASAKNAGLLTLDYWMGNRTPYRDADLRGAVLGLSLGHDRADLYASAVDSIALGSANVVTVLEQRGVAVDHIVIAGGICKNSLWLQSTVDALQRPVHVAYDDNLSLIGTAVCSAHALGIFPDLISASEACAAPTREMMPDLQRAKRYRDTMELYRSATGSLTPVLHALSARQRAGAEK